MIEYQILYLYITNRKIFDRYQDIFEFFDTNSINIFTTIKSIYNNTLNTSILKEDLIVLVNNIYEDRTIQDIIQEIYTITLDDIYIKDLLSNIYNQHILKTVQNKIESKVRVGDFENIEDITVLLETHESKTANDEFSSLDLFDQVKDQKGYSWPLQSLEEQLGPIPPGTFGCIAAPVEAGKTALVLELIHCLRQQDATVLHLNNEDPIRLLLERYYIRFFQVDKLALFSDLETYTQQFILEQAEKLHILDSSEITLDRLGWLTKKHKPDFVFVDQLDPLSNSLDPSALELLYAGIRRIAKQNQTRIIGVTQASDIDSTYVELRDLHNSKVGKQASFDFMIGLRGHDLNPRIKYISIPKNKLTGLHGKFPVAFDPVLMKFEDRINED